MPRPWGAQNDNGEEEAAEAVQRAPTAAHTAMVVVAAMEEAMVAEVVEGTEVAHREWGAVGAMEEAVEVLAVLLPAGAAAAVGTAVTMGHQGLAKEDALQTTAWTLSRELSNVRERRARQKDGQRKLARRVLPRMDLVSVVAFSNGC